jgi:fructose-bisphosphate aldolase class II
MVNYKELGLVITREMFRAAVIGGLRDSRVKLQQHGTASAIVIACAETSSTVIIQVSKGAREFATKPCCAT